MTPSDLFWGMFFGAIGTGYCVYAKKRQAFVCGACGLGLLVVPYLVSNTYVMVGTCLALVAGPFVIDEPS